MELFQPENLFTLLMLILLQAVLGFDNLLYISLESKRVEESQQSRVRKIGVALAIIMRLILLFVLVKAIDSFQSVFLDIHATGIIEFKLTGHALIVLLGGGFIIYTAMKEIFHMIGDPNLGENDGEKKRSAASAIFWIVIMNMVFSFDSILSAIALTKVFIVMAVAIVISGLMMIFLADRVSEFLEKNRMYEVLGLFVLFIVGIMLVSEGGHLAHLTLMGHPVEQMTKSTFYFVIVVMIIVDIVQGRYQKKILAEAAKRRRESATT